jgi:hypothetical protein
MAENEVDGPIAGTGGENVERRAVAEYTASTMPLGASKGHLASLPPIRLNWNMIAIKSRVLQLR